MTKKQRDKKVKRQIDKKITRQKGPKDKNTKGRNAKKTKIQRPKREFNIVASGQFLTHAMFYYLMRLMHINAYADANMAIPNSDLYKPEVNISP